MRFRVRLVSFSVEERKSQLFWRMVPLRLLRKGEKDVQVVAKPCTDMKSWAVRI